MIFSGSPSEGLRLPRRYGAILRDERIFPALTLGAIADAPNSPLLSVAHASALLQGPDLGRVSSSLDAHAWLERLLRHGEDSRRIPTGSPDFQPGAIHGGAD